MRWTQIAFVVGFNVLFIRCDWVIADVITHDFMLILRNFPG